MVSWLSAKKTLSDDRLVDVRNVKVNHLNTFLRNHRTLLEKVRAHEYRVLGRCKFLNHLNSDRIPSTIGSVVITAIHTRSSPCAQLHKWWFIRNLPLYFLASCALWMHCSMLPFLCQLMSVKMDKDTIARIFVSKTVGPLQNVPLELDWSVILAFGPHTSCNLVAEFSDDFCQTHDIESEKTCAVVRYIDPIGFSR